MNAIHGYRMSQKEHDIFSWERSHLRNTAGRCRSITRTVPRKLYQNSEFKDLYLKSVAKYLKNTFKPDRMNKIVDELAGEIENEMPYHIKKWGGSYSRLSSMTLWKNNLKRFKSSLTTRYNKVVSNIRSNFNLSNSEYNKYFGDLK